jgi:hypothetical protein
MFFEFAISVPRPVNKDNFTIYPCRILRDLARKRTKHSKQYHITAAAKCIGPDPLG